MLHLRFFHFILLLASDIFQITLPKKVGTVVDSPKPGSDKDEETKDWVTENYWKDNVQEVSAKTPSGALIGALPPSLFCPPLIFFQLWLFQRTGLTRLSYLPMDTELQRKKMMN